MGTYHVFYLIDIYGWVLLQIDIQIDVQMARLIHLNHLVEIPTGGVHRLKNLVEEGGLPGHKVGARYIIGEDTLGPVTLGVCLLQGRCYHHTMNFTEIHLMDTTVIFYT